MMDAELATDLGLELESLGVVTTHSFMGSSKQKAYKSKASIKTGPSHYIELDLLVGRCHQVLPRMQYTIPEEWAQKYKLKQSSLSTGVPNQIMIGKGACHLFPTVLECAPGLQLSRSNILGKLIVSGRAEAQDNSCLNKMVVINKTITSQNNDLVLYADRIMESPLKRCLTCVNCQACKKEIRPDHLFIYLFGTTV